jgi:quercetin dioxygenase-like cupin family protein
MSPPHGDSHMSMSPDAGQRSARVCFADPNLAVRFDVREVVIAAGDELPYDRADWDDALVVVDAGEIELECVLGGRARFQLGDILCLAGLSLRTLRNPGDEPALLVAVTRRRRTIATRRR